MKYTVKQMKSKYKILNTFNLYSSVFFIVSLVFNYFVALYVSTRNNTPASDILLSNLPVINTDWIISEGSAIFMVLVVIILLKNPRKIPLTLNSLSLFIMIRSLFISMTHLALYPGHIQTDWSKYSIINMDTDQFFSGHTGLPFLLGLIFWNNIKLRYFFILSSVVAGVAVILGHVHYTIDVFSAYFITYTIYIISIKFFKKSLLIFNS